MKKILVLLTLIASLNAPFAYAAGQVSSERTSTPVNKYIIKRGDTLWSIAKRYHCTVNQIIRLNPQVGDKVIKPNETVELPSNEVMTDIEAQVLKLVNDVRAKNGLSALKGDYVALNKSARIKAQDMAANKYFSHQSPTLGSPFEQMRNTGVTYRSAGENIAQGQTTAQQVMNDWMNSSGHRANILNANYTHMGVGYVNKYWCQQFVAR